MSRQRAGWAASRWLEKLHLSTVPKSKTAGINKYQFPKMELGEENFGEVLSVGNITGEGEAARRLKQLQRLAEKAARKKQEGRS